MSTHAGQAGLCVFVYGTLKPGGMYYQTQCETYASEAIPAWMPGRLYHLPGLEYPAVTAGEDRIEGYVLRFQDETVLTLLDEIEEYDPAHPQSSLYLRERLTVTSAQGPIEAWVYRMTPEQVTRLGGIYDPGGVWDHLCPRPGHLVDPGGI